MFRLHALTQPPSLPVAYKWVQDVWLEAAQTAGESSSRHVSPYRHSGSTTGMPPFRRMLIASVLAEAVSWLKRMLYS